jgi:hypothetical protein
MGLFTVDFDESFPESTRASVTAAVNAYKATERGRQLDAQSPNLKIKILPADDTHKTAAVGKDKVRLDPRDPAFLDPQSRRNFENHPGETPPSDAKGRIITIAHEFGHIITNQKDENMHVKNNHNVRDNENPVRQELKLPERKSYDGAPIYRLPSFRLPGPGF